MKNKQSTQATILMVTNNYFPYQGGVAQSVYASTQALQLYGYNVIIVTLDVADVINDPPYVFRVPSLIRLSFKKNPIAFSWRVTAYIKKLINQISPDIIHSHHPWLLGTSAHKVAFKVQCPIIFTHHTLYQEYAHYVPLPQKISRFFIAQHVRNYCKTVHHIVAPSDAIADMLHGESITTPVSVIPSAIRSCFFNHTLSVKNAATLPLKLVYVGRLVQEKNITALLDMLTLLPQHMYVFDCVGYGQQWNFLHDYAYKKLKLSPMQVRFHHKPDEQSLVNWYHQAHLFVFASKTDTQGLVLAESMACKTPVLALEGPGQRSIIGDNYNGYMVNNIQEMANTILYLGENLEQIERLSQGAYKTAMRYTMDEHGKQLHNLYESILRAYQK